MASISTGSSDDHQDLTHSSNDRHDDQSMSSKDLEYWAKRAAREWSLRPGPIMTFLKAASNRETLGHLWKIGTNHIRWMSGSLTGSGA
jgi:hypothetical protein